MSDSKISDKKLLIRNSYLLELGKIAGYSNSLRDEAEKSHLNRQKCKRLLFDISASLGKIIVQIDALSSMILLKYQRQNSKVKERYVLTIREMNPVAKNIDNVKSYNDDAIRNMIYNFTNNLSIHIHEINFDVGNDLTLNPISQMGEFLAMKNIGLDANWMISVCYLIAIDIAVNKGRTKLEISYPDDKKEMNLPFEQRYRELIDAMKKEGIVINEILRPLSEAFWDMRTKIVHYGHIPSPKEVQLIVEYSQEIITMITKEEKKDTVE